MDKVSVKSCKSQKGSDISKFGRGRPVSNTFHLDRIHGKGSSSNTQSQILHFILLKLTLFWLQEQVVVLQPLQNLANKLMMFF